MYPTWLICIYFFLEFCFGNKKKKKTFRAINPRRGYCNIYSSGRLDWVRSLFLSRPRPFYTHNSHIIGTHLIPPIIFSRSIKPQEIYIDIYYLIRLYGIIYRIPRVTFLFLLRRAVAVNSFAATHPIYFSAATNRFRPANSVWLIGPNCI